MEELLLLGVGYYLFTQLRKNTNAVISNTDYTPTTGTRTGSGDATDSSYDYATTLEEIETDPWTWKQRPAIFKEVPISPGSRERWLKLAQLWVSLKENEVELYAAIRDAAQTDEERGGTTNTSPIIQQYRQKGYTIMAAIRKVVNVQRKTESRFKSLLVKQYGQAAVNGFYATRKQQIIDGIWPYQETNVVPVTVGPDTATPGGDTITFDPSGNI